ncbi:MAG: cyclic 2,3-diphosphoglycerate synthase [Candidatus Thermoplasmatota archaeon]|jgi:predicted GTPase|nr:cyclic 2,3-diphosphoglycerate synthase [Candidatus Thermoplasmatota archaeon]MDP7265411.1 cyclic 2,3-diphosphoglycerate synthase [Candidatus Thermoplasmatota archaeon]
MGRKKVLILGAAGRDFHNFLTYFKENDHYRVVAFTATQIPDIDEKTFPASMAGPLYEEGIPIVSESQMEQLIREHDVDECVLAYSDLPYNRVMSLASRVNAAGADFKLMGAKSTMISSEKPLISICATRTGCGKSQTSRTVINILRSLGKRAVAIRHPMPYGDLQAMEVQRFETYDDLDKHDCTIEEREEYEPHIDNNTVVFAGVDYGKILREAEKEADIIIWDGGNNDFSFYHSDLYITVLDPLRAGHELTYYPGETSLRMADVVIINKVDTAEDLDVKRVRENVQRIMPNAAIIEAESPVTLDDISAIKGKRVLVVDDGPTLTHGGMAYGAGFVGAMKAGAGEIIDPREFATGSIKKLFTKFPHLNKVLPAMGYSVEQRMELEDTINASDADIVVSGTPIDLRRVIDPNKRVVRVRYELKPVKGPKLEDILAKFIDENCT